MTFDFDLARRMSRPGPRYTSYPTAPHFHDGFGPDDYGAALDRLRDEPDRPLSLYTHVLFCAKLCHYCGCHMRVTDRPEPVERYRAYLERELDLVAERVGEGQLVRQIHWGGGTPTTLGPAGIERLMAHTRRRFTVAADAEVGLEADPRTLTRAHLEAARRAGFNRLSFGVQSFDPVVQEAIGRVQPFEQVRQATEWARALGFEGLSFDLIYGLPHQTPERFARTLDLAASLEPDRLSVFGYAHVPWMKKHQRLIDAEALPDAEARLRLYALAFDALTARGYRHVGMDHFARPGDPLCQAQDAGTLHRNFQGYATHADCALLGFGASAIGGFGRVYAQNEKGLAAYYAALDAGRLPVARGLRLSDEDVLRRHVITRLMCDFALDKRAVEARFGIDFDRHFADALDALAALEAEGVVVLGPDRIVVPERGRPFVRNAAMAFDAYLDRAEATAAPRYSQTV
ncbi:MAG: oxygen-independent coproporphyrinogen III oxidase [Rhodothermales bacterium]